MWRIKGSGDILEQRQTLPSTYYETVSLQITRWVVIEYLNTLNISLYMQYPGNSSSGYYSNSEANSWELLEIISYSFSERYKHSFVQYPFYYQQHSTIRYSSNSEEKASDLQEYFGDFFFCTIIILILNASKVYWLLQ